jgi:hypothetical protein
MMGIPHKRGPFFEESTVIGLNSGRPYNQELYITGLKNGNSNLPLPLPLPMKANISEGRSHQKITKQESNLLSLSICCSCNELKVLKPHLSALMMRAYRNGVVNVRFVPEDNKIVLPVVIARPHKGPEIERCSKLLAMLNTRGRCAVQTNL